MTFNSQEIIQDIRKDFEKMLTKLKHRPDTHGWLFSEAVSITASEMPSEISNRVLWRQKTKNVNTHATLIREGYLLSEFRIF